MVCLGNICINTLHKGAKDNDDNDDDDDDEYNNNNNSLCPRLEIMQGSRGVVPVTLHLGTRWW
jgi:hypothetical protein